LTLKTLNETALPSYVYDIKTPEGDAFIIITEDGNKIFSVQVMMGKSGASIRAWSEAIGNMITLALEGGISLDKIIETLSSIHSDRVTYHKGIEIRSGIVGIVRGLLLYQAEKIKESIKVEMTNFESASILEMPWMEE